MEDVARLHGMDGQGTEGLLIVPSSVTDRCDSFVAGQERNLFGTTHTNSVVCQLGNAAGGKTAGRGDPRTQATQLRVCINKTCKRQGSELVMRFAKDLAIAGLEVESCGCLGECGNGPNMVFLPSERIVRHVATPADMAEVLGRECCIEVSPEMLQATEMRQSGNSLAREGDLKGAEKMFSEALALGVPESYYLLYSNRSGVRLSLQDKEGCLSDALLAVKHAPKGFTTAYIRLIDAYYIQEDYTNAMNALDALTDRNPEFLKTNDYKLIARQLKQDLAHAR